MPHPTQAGRGQWGAEHPRGQRHPWVPPGHSGLPAQPACASAAQSQRRRHEAQAAGRQEPVMDAAWERGSWGDPSKGLGRSMSLVPVCWHTAANKGWAG